MENSLAKFFPSFIEQFDMCKYIKRRHWEGSTNSGDNQFNLE